MPFPEGTADVPAGEPLVAVSSDNEAANSETSKLDFACQLLGGLPVLRHEVSNTLDVHEMLLFGLPWEALNHLSEHLVIMGKGDSLETAIGISPRTFQRRLAEPAKRLSLVQSGRTWKFVEILARATSIFGSQEDAENWLQRNAIGLDQRRPIDLLQTPAGVELLEEHLTRLEYGVYA
jgi:putative toxin-antitoxin system antitoxin component (TIGR02293 family)